MVLVKEDAAKGRTTPVNAMKDVRIMETVVMTTKRSVKVIKVRYTIQIEALNLYLYKCERSVVFTILLIKRVNYSFSFEKSLR